jgi:hypothetical protein
MVKSVSEKLTLKVKAMGTQYDQNYYPAPPSPIRQVRVSYILYNIHYSVFIYLTAYHGEKITKMKIDGLYIIYNCLLFLSATEANDWTNFRPPPHFFGKTYGSEASVRSHCWICGELSMYDDENDPGYPSI